MRIYTSESVSEGHPDKLADQISDALLDAFLEQDGHSRVAIETLLTRGAAVVAGEVTTGGFVDVAKVGAAWADGKSPPARSVLRVPPSMTRLREAAFGEAGAATAATPGAR